MVYTISGIRFPVVPSLHKSSFRCDRRTAPHSFFLKKDSISRNEPPSFFRLNAFTIPLRYFLGGVMRVVVAILEFAWLMLFVFQSLLNHAFAETCWVGFDSTFFSSEMVTWAKLKREILVMLLGASVICSISGYFELILR